MNFRLLIFSLAIFIVGIISCSNPTKDLMKKTFGKNFTPPENYAYIPSGDLFILKKEKVSVQGFFISKFEITNQQYTKFLNDLLQKGRKEDHLLADRKAENWLPTSYNPAPYAETYPNHPAYFDYPVLTISKVGAKMYCDWMEENLKTKYPNFNITIRLPTEEEWMYAAKGGRHNAIYPWKDNFLRNTNGTIRANFKRLGANRIHYDRKNNTYEFIAHPSDTHHNVGIPAPVKSFTPNDFGLYHMSGNVAEMLSTISPSGGNRTKGGCYNSGGWDIRIDAEDEFDGWLEPSQYIGFRPVLIFSKK